MQSVLQDLRYGLRMLAKNPGFTAVALVTLALGIGANAAIFSVVNGVLLRPLDYRDPARLAMLWEDDRQEGNDRNPVAPANFVDWRTQNEVFEQIEFYSQPGGVNLTGSEETERVQVIGVSHNLLSMLGAAPLHGRVFLAVDEQPDSASVVVLSHGLWQRRFGGDPAQVGKTVQLDGDAFQVIGVMPPSFRLPEEAELWTPIALRGPFAALRGRHFLRVIGRLKPAVTPDQARASMAVIASRLEQQYPETNKDRGVQVVPLKDQVVGTVRPALRVLLGAVSFVLLIACANVANLLLARGARRHQEIAIRSAVGAGRGRLVRQFLTESALLALLGGLLGALLAYAAVDVLVASGSARIPRVEAIVVDRWVLGFTFVVSLLTGTVVGLAPALILSAGNLSEAIKSRGGVLELRGRQHFRSVLVAVEMSLALILLVGAGLMIKSFARLQNVDPGYRTDHVFTAQLSLPFPKYRESHRMVAFYGELLERIRALPGVHGAGAISRLPMAGDRSTTSLGIEGRPTAVGESREVHYRSVTSDYFQVLGISTLKGRAFNDRDVEAAAPVAIINESTARKFWPHEEATGKRIKLGGSPWLAIVGVIRDGRNFGLDTGSQPEAYVHFLQSPSDRMRLVVRTVSEPTSVAAAVREAVRAIDKDLAMSQVSTLDGLLARSIAQRRLNMFLLLLFAAVALALAAVGIYGVLSYTVAQRTSEIGIRMALGAERTDVLRLVLAQGIAPAAAGLGVGVAGALALTRLMAGLLYEVSPTDAATFVAIPVLLAVVALAAIYIPARRATKVDPMMALRCE